MRQHFDRMVTIYIINKGQMETLRTGMTSYEGCNVTCVTFRPGRHKLNLIMYKPQINPN
jgi:hypothetical protein